MTTSTVLFIVALLAVATAGSLMVAPIWRDRHRRETGPDNTSRSPGPVSSPTGEDPVVTDASVSRRARGGRRRRVAEPSVPGRNGRRTPWHRARAAAQRWWRDGRTARWGPVAAAVVGLCAGLGLAGPAAGLALALYAGTAFVLLRAAARRRSQARARRLATDAVVGLAADLRAGVPVASALSTAASTLARAQATVLPDRPKATTPEIDRVASLIDAAASLSHASGAPLADVLDRLDAHLRAIERMRAAANAQAAGSHASAGLLAAMPIAGLGVGVLMGVDPWRVLLHTATGSGVLIAAIALQLAGIAWTVRLSRVEVPS